MADERTPARPGDRAAALARAALAQHLGVATGSVRAQGVRRAAREDGTVRWASLFAAQGSTWRVLVDAAAAPQGSADLTVVEVADTEAPGRGAEGWDAAHDPHRPRGARVSAAPNPSVAQAVRDLPPGSVLDIACGTGRHALWLAERGWQSTGLDFSRNALAVAAAAAQQRRVHVRWHLGDARVWTPPDDGYDLVLMAFVRLPPVIARAARWVRPGGRLVIVGAAERHATEGTGGPRDPRLLHDVVDLAARVTGARLRVLVAREAERRVDGGVAVDAVVVATRVRAA